MKRRKTRKTRQTGQSLTAAGKIHPEKWNISPQEAAFALKALGIPVKQVRKVCCLPHQVCVSYWNEQDKACSSFFSYRAFPTWQQAVEQAIATTQNIPQFEYLAQIVEYDLVQFPYPVEMADAIWDALKNHQYELLAAKRLAEIEQSPAAKPTLSLASWR